MRGHYNIPLTLIFRCAGKEQLLSLFYYYRLRNVHRNNIFYNANFTNLSKALKLSRQSTKEHLRVMIENGWVEYYSSTNKTTYLKLTGITKLNRKNKGCVVKIPIMGSRKDQLAAFRYALIHKDLQRQQYAIDTKNRIVTHLGSPFGKVSKKEFKYYRKNFFSLSHLATSINNDVTLSNRSIGRISFRSQRTGSNYQSQMRKLGLIQTRPRYEVVAEKVPVEAFFNFRELNNFPKGVGYSDGSIIRQKSNLIIPCIRLMNSGSKCRL